MSLPEVSVVLAVRDGLETLDAALDSVLDQQGVELELVAVDDRSSDGTAERLAAWAARDPRVRVLEGPGEGLTAALRVGCAAARAPWIARQDARDLSLPGRLRAQLDATRDRPRLALVSCLTEVLAPGGELLYLEDGGAIPDEEQPVSTGARRIGPSAHGSVLFRRDLYERVGGYRVEFPLAQDWDLWLRLGEVGTFLAVGRTLYCRTLSPTSASFRLRALQLELGRTAEHAARERRERGEDRESLARARRLAARWARERARPDPRAEALAHYHFGEVLRRRGEPAARAYLGRAVRMRPTLLRAWVRLAQSGLSARAKGPSRAEAGR